MQGPSPVVASRGHSSSRCVGLLLSRPLFAEHGSGRAGSVVVAHGLSCSAACGIFPDQGSNPCPLHQQADSQPLRHQGSPARIFYRWYSCFLLHLIRRHMIFGCSPHWSQDWPVGYVKVLATITDHGLDLFFIRACKTVIPYSLFPSAFINCDSSIKEITFINYWVALK